MMRRIVLLYGQSLLLSGLATSLRRHPRLRVTRAATWPEASRLLASRARLPDVLIFDLANSSASHVLPLLFKKPGMLLIGLDPDRDLAVLVGGREARSLTLQQIVEIAEEA